MSRNPKYPAHPKLRLSLPLRRRRPGLLSRLWRRLSPNAPAEPRPSPGRNRPGSRHQAAGHQHGPRHLPGAHPSDEPEIQLKIAVPKPRPTRVGPLAEAALKKKFKAGTGTPPAEPITQPGAKPLPEPETKPVADAPRPSEAPVAPAVPSPPMPPAAPAVQPEPVGPIVQPQQPEPSIPPTEPEPSGPPIKPPVHRPSPVPRLGTGARRSVFWLVLALTLLAGLGGYYGYRRYAQPPPRAKVARIPAASLPKVVPLEAGLFERYARSQDQAILTEVTVAPGSNLSKALEEIGLTSRSNYRGVLDCLTGGPDSVDRVLPGAVLRAFWADPEMENLARLEFYPAAGAAPLVVLSDGQDGFWRYSLASRPMNISGAGSGRVEGSLWNAGLRAGLDGGLIMAMADVLASDIDFFTGLQKGDSFEVLYSRDYLDGRPQGTPVIEMLRMKNKGRDFEYYLYKNNDKGQAGYYNRKGYSNRKTFFATPLSYTRISSGFSMARKHPIYKVVRPHQGVDYAAPTGTPVSAVADGKVIAARWSGGFGRLVTIQHDSTYTTMYGHLSSFAPGLKEGAMVRQGDLIGRVGASGAATGPHLDFRLRKNGVFVNPIPELARQVGRRLEGAELAALAGVIPNLEKRLKTQLALAARRPVAVETLSLEPEVDFGESEAPLDMDL